MSDLIRSLILGVVQGLTEFLPISSSGHLELVNHFFGSSESLDSDLAMVILVHFGTAMSILYVFRVRIIEIIGSIFSFKYDSNIELVINVIISMIPAAVIGLLFDDHLEAIFSGSILYVGIFLMITGVILYFTPNRGNFPNPIGNKQGLLIGIAQAIAILPGISRSGMTIATALFQRSNKEKAAEFSFLMVLPIIIGKMILDVGSGELTISHANALPVGIAFFSSFIVGIMACRWMINIVKNSHLRHFAYYCLGIGLLTIAIATFS